MRRAAGLVLAVLAIAAAPAAAGSPAGANDWSCRPSPFRPAPVILVHGTFMDMHTSWQAVSPRLAREGHCVFALDLPARATAPIERSAQVLDAFTSKVLAATGAPRVSYVGHSQGGMLPRYLAKLRGRAGVIDDIVALAPSSRGTTTPLAPLVAPFCPACGQQVAGSGFYGPLNAPPEAPAPVSYTVLTTRYDEVVTPYASQALEGATNVIVQDACPTDVAEHVSIIYDPVALQWILDALANPGPADPELAPDCFQPRTPPPRAARRLERRLKEGRRAGRRPRS